MSGTILVPFSVHPAALDFPHGADLDPAHIRRLVSLWRQVGVLVLPDGPDPIRELYGLDPHRKSALFTDSGTITGSPHSFGRMSAKVPPKALWPALMLWAW